MSKAYSLFRKNMESTRDINSIFNYLSTSAPTVDASPLLRAEFALIISSFDKYIHDLVRETLVNQFSRGKVTDATLSTIPLSTTQINRLKNESVIYKRESVLAFFIQKEHSTLTFQSPNKVEQILSLININNVWDKLSVIIGKSADDVKKQLSLLVHRRNKIVHEADIDYATGLVTPITGADIDLCYGFIADIVSAIDNIS